MKKSTLRRADMVFSVVLMVVSFVAMVESVKLLFNPFGRDFADVRGDDIKNNILNWYQSVGSLCNCGVYFYLRPVLISLCPERGRPV